MFRGNPSALWSTEFLFDMENFKKFEIKFKLIDFTIKSETNTCLFNKKDFQKKLRLTVYYIDKRTSFKRNIQIMYFELKNPEKSAWEVVRKFVVDSEFIASCYDKAEIMFLLEKLESSNCWCDKYFDFLEEQKFEIGRLPNTVNKFQIQKNHIVILTVGKPAE